MLSLGTQVKVALCQLHVTADKDQNISTARAAIQVRCAAQQHLLPAGVGHVLQLAKCPSARGHSCSGLWPLLPDLSQQYQMCTGKEQAFETRACAVPEAHTEPRAPCCASTSTPQEAASNGAQLVVLPEMWNCPYSNDSFPTYAGAVPCCAVAVRAVVC